MKALGIIRKVDELGRVTIPVEVRRNLEIDTGSSIEMFIDDKNLVLRKYEDPLKIERKYKAIEILENMYEDEDINQSDVLTVLKYVKG